MPVDLKLSLEKLQAKTKAARLRALMPVIEAKIQEGVRHADIVIALNEQGFEVTEMTYRNYLQRHRQKRGAAGSAAAGANPSGDNGMHTALAPLSVPLPRVAGSRPPTFEHDPKGDPDLLK